MPCFVARQWKQGRAAMGIWAVVLGVWSAPVAVAYDPLAGDYSKDDPLDVRIVAYNHNRSFIEDPSEDAVFERILTALNPDIICFEEFTSSVSESDVANRLDSILPVAGGGSWQIHFGLLGGIRTVIASRFPLTMTRIDTIPASSTRGVTIALADLPNAVYSADVYLLGVHLKCCGDPGGSEDDSRQDSADAIANWLGDARGVARPSGNNVTLAPDTPMISLGDFNLVGGPQPETTLITGDIQDEGTYGPDVKGDWDNSNLTDLTPTDPFTGDTFTWQGNQNFPPGRLDRFFYTDSVVTVANSFILNTDTMTPAALAAAGLQAGDTLTGNSSDHLPIAMDLRLVSGPECTVNADCEDGAFCNGAATCDTNGVCLPGTDPCPGQICDEGNDICVDCLADGHCNDGLFCNGAETCVAGSCQSGTDPCPGAFCDDLADVCRDCLLDSDCDDAVPCNGVETCDAGGACQSGVCEAQVALLAEDFDFDPGAFAYQDDTFRGTSNPSSADGTYEAAGGLTGGGVRVVLGAQSTDMSGGWVASFQVAGSPTSVEVNVAYRLLLDGGYESDEYGQALLAVDGVLLGVAPNDYLIQFVGDGNSPSDPMDSGWLTETLVLSLGAGTHQIAVGGYSNKSTAGNEITEIFFDDVAVTAFYDAACTCDDGVFCNGAEICDAAETCQSGPPPDCDDGLACTQDPCSAATDACDNTPIDALCDDGLFCNGPERCDSVLGCTAGSAPCVGSTWCSEADDACVGLGDGDFEPDGDRDHADYAAFQRCFGVEAGPACYPANLTGVDGLIDLDDFETFAVGLTGP